MIKKLLMVSIGIIGLGFVGGAMYKSFKIKKCKVMGYDKFKDSDTIQECFNSDIIFICVPTQFDSTTSKYDLSNIIETCQLLKINKYTGLVVIKCTVEPETTKNLAMSYPMLKLIHNPEFLTAATAFEDFHNQAHIVIGKSDNVNDFDILKLTDLYTKLYPDAVTSLCSCTESESMKSFVNCFYSVKIQFFNELYFLCQKMDIEYDNVKNLMIKNKWINPMHTNVPGPDGKLSYGGFCFPKDTNALLNFMKIKNTPSKVLQATIDERNLMRKDHTNCIYDNSLN